MNVVCSVTKKIFFCFFYASSILSVVQRRFPFSCSSNDCCIRPWQHQQCSWDRVLQMNTLMMFFAICGKSSSSSAKVRNWTYLGFHKAHRWYPCGRMERHSICFWNSKEAKIVYFDCYWKKSPYQFNTVLISTCIIGLTSQPVGIDRSLITGCIDNRPFLGKVVQSNPVTTGFVKDTACFDGTLNFFIL